MIIPDYIDLYRQVLDHPLLDCDDFPCGTVDDIELDWNGDGGTPRVTALLIGPGAWGPRLPALLSLGIARCIGTRLARVPWHEVSSLGEFIRLRSRASVLGLGYEDRKLGLLVGKLPGSERKAT